MSLYTGDIRQRTASSFEWKIPNWRNSLSYGLMYQSPRFLFLNAAWNIQILNMSSVSFTVCRHSMTPDTVKIKLCLEKDDIRKCIILDGEESFYEDISSTPIRLQYYTELLNHYTTSCGSLIISCEFLSSQAMDAQRMSSNCTCMKTRMKRKRPEENRDDEHVDKENIEDLGKLSEDLRDFFFSGKGSDVTFIVQDRTFKAHKAFLQARLPFFDAMFTHDMKENNSNLVTISDCVPEIFENLLLYLYTGKVENISEGNVVGLYQVADKYGINPVKAKCARFMVDTLSVQTFCDVIALGLEYSDKALIEEAIDFFADNQRAIILGDKWLSFLKEHPVKANEIHIKALDRRY